MPTPFRRTVVPPIESSPDRSPKARSNISAKRFKLTPWDFLDHNLVIWIDANMQVVSPAFAREALAAGPGSVAFFLHPRRSCVYEEGEALLGPESQGGKFDDQPIAEQIDHYRGAGYPENAGLWASGVIAWDARRPQVRRFGAEWLAEVERWSVRDQLSLPIVARRLSFEPDVFPFPLLEERADPDYLGNRWLRIWPHGYSASVLAMTNPSVEHEASAARYDFDEIDLTSDSVHADVVRLVDRDSRVLELGPATGYMSKAFVDRDCTVIGIELDADMATKADRFCERVIVGDLDSLDFEQELGEERFDAIVAADVLEHLRDPLAVVRRLKEFLKPAGYFVISFPNVAHGSVRLSLLEGHFDYQDIGLLDSTHLRFFTRESFEELLDEADLGLAVLHRHDLNLDASEVSFDGTAIPAAVRDQLEKDPDARTYQYVVKAQPMPGEGLREIQARLRELVELREFRDREQGRVAELEAALAAIGGREGELRGALIDVHDQLLRRDAEIDAMRKGAANHEKDLENVRTELDRVNGELVAALSALQRIRASAPYRLLAALKSLLRSGA